MVYRIRNSEHLVGFVGKHLNGTETRWFIHHSINGDKIQSLVGGCESKCTNNNKLAMIMKKLPSKTFK